MLFKNLWTLVITHYMRYYSRVHVKKRANNNDKMVSSLKTITNDLGTGFNENGKFTMLPCIFLRNVFSVPTTYY